MPTAHTERLLPLIPAARQAALNTWWDANIDTDGSGQLTFTIGLNASGLAVDPVTHYWCCTALTIDQLKKIGILLCNMAGITPPAQWNTWTRQQKKQWVIDTAPQFLATLGIRVVPMDNDGVWSSPDALLATAGLKRIKPSMP